MKKILLSIALFASITVAYCQNKNNNECSSGWAKYENNPVLGGGNTGTIYDVNVLKNDDGGYRMYCSWLDRNGIALAESKDGLKWSLSMICLNDVTAPRAEGHVNRPVVIEKDGMYHMWYSDQVPFRSKIGYAVSNDGKNWTRKGDMPVLSADASWEKGAVLCSQVIWDEQEQLFKMWYSAGDKFDPDAIGYATSKDGMNWEKYKNNPVFTANKQNKWEQAKVAGCQVIKRPNDYLMFYIGYMDPDHAQIGMARSKDGITNWERFNGNPIIGPGAISTWDSYAVYKPYAIPDPANNRWLLYYNGRCGWDEPVGIAIHEGMNLGF